MCQGTNNRGLLLGCLCGRCGRCSISDSQSITDALSFWGTITYLVLGILGAEDSVVLGEVETSLFGIETALFVSVATGLGSVSLERRTRLREFAFESAVGLGASVVAGGATG